MGSVIVIVPTCSIHEPLEDTVDELNAQLNGEFAFILAKDFRWHPEVLRIKSGTTVVWLFADVHNNGQQHDPRTSSTCGSEAADLNRCAPPFPQKWGQCFWVTRDQGGSLRAPQDPARTPTDQRYPVTLRYDPLGGVIQKSHGFRAGTPVGSVTGAQAFLNCPADTATMLGDHAVIPYHCGFHGTPFTFFTQMRGAIVIDP